MEDLLRCVFLKFLLGKRILDRSELTVLYEFAVVLTLNDGHIDLAQGIRLHQFNCSQLLSLRWLGTNWSRVEIGFVNRIGAIHRLLIQFIIGINFIHVSFFVLLVIFLQVIESLQFGFYAIGMVAQILALAWKICCFLSVYHSRVRVLKLRVHKHFRRRKFDLKLVLFCIIHGQCIHASPQRELFLKCSVSICDLFLITELNDRFEICVTLMDLIFITEKPGRLSPQQQ